MGSSNWKDIVLEDAIEFRNGKTSPQRQDNGANPVYGGNGVIGYTEEYNSTSETIIIGRVGAYCGSVYFYEGSCWVTDNAIIGKIRKDYDGRFLFYLLKLLNLNNHRTGSSQPLVNQTILNSIQIRVPREKQNQMRIASILSALDEKIELNRQTNQTLEAIAQAIYKEWFVNFNFPDDEGKPYQDNGGEMQESELGLIPKGWRVARLGEVLDTIESGTRPKGGVGDLSNGIPSIGAENIIGLGKYDYSKEKYISEDFFKKMNRGIVRSKDVLLYKDGASLGRKSMFMNDFPHKICAVNEHVFILRTNEQINQYFLYFWLDQSFMTENIRNLNTNSAQPGINQSGVSSLQVLIPCKEVLQKFEVLIEPLLNQLFVGCKQNTTLSKIRDIMLPKLMNGEIEV